MDLSNPFEVELHYLLIGEMISLGHQDGVPRVSALVCIVTHWTEPTVSHDTRLLGSHHFTKLLCCIIFQP